MVFRTRFARARLQLLLGGLLALSAFVALTATATYAAYAVSTANANSTIAAGTVILADNGGGVAPFSVGAATPGDTGSRCVRVTYSGSLAANVRLYLLSTSGALGDRLTVSVEAGTGAALDCSDFASSSTLLAATALTAAQASYSSFATGLDTWAPTGGSGATRTYRVTWRFPVVGANDRLGATVSSALKWEAQSA